MNTNLKLIIKILIEEGRKNNNKKLLQIAEAIIKNKKITNQQIALISKCGLIEEVCQ
jgi:hypothetical protein